MSRLSIAALLLWLPALWAQPVRITSGIADYQVFQRDGNAATIVVHGTAEKAAEGKTIQAALLMTTRTATGQPMRVLQMNHVGTVKGGQWTATLERVPAGGPYNITFTVQGNPYQGASVRGVLVGDLWVLAGQSNMEGYGDLVETQSHDERVNSFDMRDEWRLALEPLHSLPDSADPVHWRRVDGQPRRMEGAERDQWIAARKKGAGLGLPFAVEMARRTGVPVGLVPCAHGGTSMDQWSPALKDQGGNSLYGAMIRRVRAVGGKVAGVLWYQGESDANPKAAPEFASKFDRLVASVRSDVGNPELPFYWVQIGRHVNNTNVAEWNQVQNAQLAAETTLGKNVGTVPAVDSALDDGIHVSTPDLKRLGKRLANLACHDRFPEVTACSSLKRGPRPVEMKLTSPGMLRVTFRDINGKLASEGRIGGFSLRGPAGEDILKDAHVYKAVLDPKDPSAILVSFGGKLPAGAMLWYGAGKDPYCNLKDSADMAVPVFGLPIH